MSIEFDSFEQLERRLEFLEAIVHGAVERVSVGYNARAEMDQLTYSWEEYCIDYHPEEEE